MKFFFISLAVLLSVVFGLYKSIYKPRPLLLKLFTGISIITALVIAVFPPIYYEVDTLFMLNRTNNFTSGAVAFASSANSPHFYDDKEKQVEFYFAKDTMSIQFDKLPAKLENKIVEIQKLSSGVLKAVSIQENDALFYLPYIPALGQYVRMFGIHVPLAWVAVLAYLFTLVFSIKFLVKKEVLDDIIVRASAMLGTLFCIAATVTGMLWAKESWGSYWSWDPRQTSIFVLLLIYFAYFILRASIENPESKRIVTAAYAVIASISMPFFIFVLPRISSGLHPGSADDTLGGPIISTGKSMLDSSLLFSFSASMFAFSLAFFLLLSHYVIKYLKKEKEDEES